MSHLQHKYVQTHQTPLLHAKSGANAMQTRLIGHLWHPGIEADRAKGPAGPNFLLRGLSRLSQLHTSGIKTVRGHDTAGPGSGRF
jgi:hypothetical protein